MTRHLEGAQFRGLLPTGRDKHYAYLWSLKNAKMRTYLAGINKPVELLVIWCDKFGGIRKCSG